jgi:CHAT domain-containing protein
MTVRLLTKLALATMVVATIAVIGKWQFDRATDNRSYLDGSNARAFEGRISNATQYRPYSSSRFTLRADVPVRQLIDRADEPDATLTDILSGSAIEAAAGGFTSSATRLAEAARKNPNSFAAWLDLSAVLLARQARDEDAAGQLLTASIDASLHAASLDAGDPRAWFNAAVAFERFGMTAAADDAFRSSAEREHDAGWKAEIEARRKALARRNHRAQWDGIRATLINLDAPVDAHWLSSITPDYRQPIRELIEDQLLPQWGAGLLSNDRDAAARVLARATVLSNALKAVVADPWCAEAINRIRTTADPALLAQAFRRYGEAQRAYEASDREGALVAIDASIAGFERAGASFVDRARVRRASTLFQLNRSDEAERLALEVERRSARTAHPSVQAAAAWLAGIAQTQRGAADEALQSYARAQGVLERIGERQDLAGVHTSIANLLRVTGDLANGWVHLTAATRLLDDVHSARRHHTMLLNTSLFAADQDRLLAAVAFEQWSLRAAEERGVANTIVDAHMRLARLRLRTGDVRGASADLRAAIEGSAAIGSQSAKSYVDSWLALAAGESALSSSPTRALEEFDRAAQLFAVAEPAQLPSVYLAAARARTAMNDTAGAEQELRKGIDVVIARRDQIRDMRLQTAYQDASWDLFDRLIDLSVDRGEQEEAFRLAETSRNLVFGRSQVLPQLTLQQLAQGAPPGATVVYFVVTGNRLLIWTIANKSVSFTTRPIGRDELDGRVNRYRAALMADAADVDAQAQALYRLLLDDALRGTAPDSLVLVVPAAALHRIPFGSLRDAEGRYAIELHPIAVMPSAAALLNAARSPGGAKRDTPIVIVGSSRVPGLPALPEVADEVRQIAAQYPHARALVGDTATYARTLKALSGATALHFAGHAQANTAVPWQSRLFFVPDPSLPSGVVTAAMLLKQSVESLQLVVFSACETGDGPILRGTGISSIAATMLSLGVPSVVASLWAVEDRPLRRLLTAFHGNYANGAPAASALRSAQLAMLRSGDPMVSRPQHWSGVTVASAR